MICEDRTSMDPQVPEAERAFYVEEFAASTIVVSLAEPDDATVAAASRVAGSLGLGGSRLVLVVGGGQGAGDRLSASLPRPAALVDAAPAQLAGGWLAELWLTLTDGGVAVVTVDEGREAQVAAELAVDLRALKLVVTDDGGGWGRPPRSFADVASHASAYRNQLAERQGGAVVAAVDRALAGGVTNVNLCRAADLDLELFTFDGAGTLFTSGGYLTLGPLRVDDLTAVERLVAQGVADGLLRPRTRHEIARLAIDGLGARVVGSGHLAGIVSLETDRYRAERMGEVACLYTVSRFSGAGAGALLLDGLVDRAREQGLLSVFAVTVSDAAAAFFTRRAFREADHDAVPAAKWDGYDGVRRAEARVFVRDVNDQGEQASFGF
jgi:amino-acid N-acetyltransferase